ncbi:MAG TPA: hypothetical protein VK673_21770 [Chthoniobacterales bacterium]|nr:hypothetical protein [Chthoniobacterales bacterium]
MAATLQSYIFFTQRLLHDAQAQTWPVSPDLINYVNLARDRVALDTAATRVLPIITLNALQERYSHAYVQQAVLNLAWQFNGTAPASRGIGCVIGINCIQSTAYQPPLSRMAWTELNVRYRQGGPTTAGSFPEAWAPYADNQNFYIACVPGSTLTAEIDCQFLPNPLVNLTDNETAIADPLSDLVPLMAARWAMYYMDEQDTALVFWTHYLKERDELVAQLPGFAGFNVQT